jgi:hypothetical protein
MWKDFIEDIVTKELRSLCNNCLHYETCVYRITATKSVIQCELFQLDDEQEKEQRNVGGLCKTCDHAVNCSLPGRRMGTWHCNEFK